MSETQAITKVEQTENKQGAHKFDQGSVLSVLIKTAIPIAILMICNSVYAFVDSLMASSLVVYSEGAPAGATGTAMPVLNGGTIFGLIMPLMSFVIAFEIMIAVAAGLSFTQSLSENKPEEARERHKEAMSLIIYIGLGVILFTAIIGIPYTLLVSGNLHGDAWGEHTKQMTLDSYVYMLILTFAFIPMQLQQSFVRVLRAEGKGDVAALIPIMTIPVNVFFDWVFMGALNMGIYGAGLATLIAAVFGLAVIMIYVSKASKSDALTIRLQMPRLKLNKMVVNVIILFAMGSLLRRVFDSLIMIVLSTYIGNMDVSGTDIVLTDWEGSWTVMTRSMNMGSQITLGIAQAMSMLVTYFVYSKQYGKLKETMYYGIMLMTSLSVLISLLLFGIQGSLFKAYDSLHHFGWGWFNGVSIAFTIALVYIIPVSLQTFCVMFYAGTKKAKWTFTHSAIFNATIFIFATAGLIINQHTGVPMYLFTFMTVGALVGFVVVVWIFVIRYKQFLQN